jgi:hypothetical protein
MIETLEQIGRCVLAVVSTVMAAVLLSCALLPVKRWRDEVGP